MKHEYNHNAQLLKKNYNPLNVNLLDYSKVLLRL